VALTASGVADWDIAIPPYGSGPSGNFIDAVNGSKPVLVWGGASEGLFQKGGAVGAKVFGLFTPAGQYMDSGLTILRDQKYDAKTVAFIQNDSPFSVSVCTGARTKATALGYTLVGETINYKRTDTQNEIEMTIAGIREEERTSLT
jgi:ABC-type branched-subunit amino acid transport system substrate-binding protein